MIVEQGTYAQFKDSLLYGTRRQAYMALMAMSEPCFKLENWWMMRLDQMEGDVCGVFVTTLDSMDARLHVETHIFRSGLNFELTVAVGREGLPTHYWRYSKQPPAKSASPKSARQSVPAHPSPAWPKFRELHLSDH